MSKKQVKYVNKPNVKITEHSNLAAHFLYQLYQLNQMNPHKAYFSSFTMPQNPDKSKFKKDPKRYTVNGMVKRWPHDDGNYFDTNPMNFYNSKYLNYGRHNWFSLTTFRPYNKRDKHISYNDRKFHVHPTSRADRYVSAFNGHAIDIDCMQNGVNPKDLLKRIDKAVAEHKMFKPSYIQDSGHGLYAIFLYKKPFIVGANDKAFLKTYDKKVDAYRAKHNGITNDEKWKIYDSVHTTQRKNQINTWKNRQQVLVRRFNHFTDRWYGKDLGDVKSTNPGRIYRMPNTLNVKVSDNGVNFSHPYTSYIIKGDGTPIDTKKLADFTWKYAPLYPDHVVPIGTNQTPMQRRQKFNDSVEGIDNSNDFYGRMRFAMSHADDQRYDDSSAVKMMKPDTMHINLYKYSSHKGTKSPFHKGLLKGFNQFNLMDYLVDNNINLIKAGKSYVFTKVNHGKNSHDKSSIMITQLPDIKSPQYKAWKKGHGKEEDVPTYTQLGRISGNWDKVIGAFYDGDKLVYRQGKLKTKAEIKHAYAQGYHKLSSVVAFISANHNYCKPSVAKKIYLKWCQQYAKKGNTKTRFPFYKYGSAKVSKGQGRVNFHGSRMDIAQGIYKDRPMKVYTNITKKDDVSGLAQKAGMESMKVYKELHEAEDRLADDTPEDSSFMLEDAVQATLKIDKKRIAKLKPKAHKIGEKFTKYYNMEKSNSEYEKQSKLKAADWVNKHVVNNDIARNYLIHQRCLSPKLVEFFINRRLVTGINGHWYHPYERDKKGNYKVYHPYLKDKNGNVVTKNGKPVKDMAKSKKIVSKKKVWQPPYVEFVWRKPRNPAEAHTNFEVKPNYKNTWEWDYYYSTHRNPEKPAHKGGVTTPRAIAYGGLQGEVPCGCDQIFVKPTKETFKGKDGKIHHVLDKDTSIHNGSGKGIDNGTGYQRDYGFNFKNGTGKKRLFVFEAPIDAMSFYEEHAMSKNPKDRAEIKNATFLSLGGSGSKASQTVSNFMRQNYALDDNYGHVITCTDNDWAGYKVPLDLTSTYGTAKVYTHHRRSNQRLVTTEVPVSNDRNDQTAVLRTQADKKNVGQKGSFNKDWNAEMQSMVRYNKHFDKYVGKRFNAEDYTHMLTKQMMVQIQHDDTELGKIRHLSKSQVANNVGKDLSYADAYLNLASSLYQKSQHGNEDINTTNPKIEHMNSIKQYMTKGIRHKLHDGGVIYDHDPFSDLNKYVDTVSSAMTPDDMAEASNHIYKEVMGHPNVILKNKEFQKIESQHHALPKLQQAVNNTLSSIKNDDAKRLSTTAIISTSNIWKRRLYSYYHNDNKERRYLNRSLGHPYAYGPHHKKNKNYIYPLFSSANQIISAQNNIDNIIRRDCLGRLKKQYPKQYAKTLHDSPDVAKFGNVLMFQKLKRYYYHDNDKYQALMKKPAVQKVFHEVRDTKNYLSKTDAFNCINRAHFIKEYMRSNDEHTYRVKQVLFKNQMPVYKGLVSQIDQGHEEAKEGIKRARAKRQYYKNKRQAPRYNNQRNNRRYNYKYNSNALNRKLQRRAFNQNNRNGYKNTNHFGQHKSYSKMNNFMSHISPAGRKATLGMIGNIYASRIDNSGKKDVKQGYLNNSLNEFKSLKNNNDKRYITSHKLSNMSTPQLKAILQCANFNKNNNNNGNDKGQSNSKGNNRAEELAKMKARNNNRHR